jgi:hypothetical protein
LAMAPGENSPGAPLTISAEELKEKPSPGSGMNVEDFWPYAEAIAITKTMRGRSLR